MSIQFADHSDFTLPALLPRLSAPASGAIQAREAVASPLRREIEPSTAESLFFPARTQADTLLRPFLEAESESEAQKHLEILIQSKAAPIIARVVRQKWQVIPNRAYGSVQKYEEREAEDLYSDALTLLLARLRVCREDRAKPVITHFAAYVAMTASRVCAERLRRVCPERESCRQRLRYLLKTHTELALWRDDWDRPTCGVKADQGRNPSQAALLRLQAWETRRGSANVSGGMLTGLELTSLLAWLGGPVLQEKLVGTLSTVLRIAEPTDRRPSIARQGLADDDTLDPLADLKEARVEVAGEVEQRLCLRWLWTEILQLRPRQRAALLLNLRDGQNRGVLALLAHAHIATLTEIAQAIGLSAAEFGTYWRALPLEDTGVAELLACTPQQVSNLRKAARARLSRRLCCYEQGLHSTCGTTPERRTR